MLAKSLSEKRSGSHPGGRRAGASSAAEWRPANKHAAGFKNSLGWTDFFGRQDAALYGRPRGLPPLIAPPSPKRIHADRIARRHCHHCDPRRDAAAGSFARETESDAGVLPEQSTTDRSWVHHVRG